MKNRDSVLLYLSMPILWARNGFAWLREKTKPAIALLAAVTLLLSMVPMQALASTSGVEISTLSDLQSFKARIASGESSLDAVLIANIDMSSVTNWNGIGTEENPYTGTFDGQGHTISNLTGSMGLFAQSSGTVKNVYLKNVSINGGGNNGAIVGHNKGTVFNCVSTGTVSGNSWSVGGVVGYNQGGTVLGCISSCTVSGGTAGGLVGSNYNNGRISYSYYGGANPNIEGDWDYAKASSEAVYFQTDSGYQLYNNSTSVSASTVVTVINDYIADNSGYFKLSLSGNNVQLPHMIHPICGAEHKDVGNHTGTCADLTWTAWDGTTPLANGGRYYLSKDVTIDSTLVISGTVSLCLNGKTLKYENASVQGSVIEVYLDATLNLCNCSGLGNGRITGGNTDSLGGGVYVDSDATFNMFSGTISGNTAATGGGVAVIIYGAFAMYGGSVSGNSADDGGGVFSRGSFTMYGGSIADNTAANYGAGVYVNTTSAALSGASVIRYNYTGTGEQSNVYLNGSSIHKLTVGTLSEGASIGVTLSGSTGTFTNGGAAFKDKFFSDNSDYIVGVTGNHLMLARPVTLSFDGNGGTGSMASVQVADGSEYTLPESGFTAPTGKLFKAWTIGDTEYAAGDTVTVSGDTTVKAVWENIPADAPEVATSNAHVDVTYGEYNNVQLSVTVTEKEGYEYTYQWFIETTIGNILSGPIDNATESAYTLPNDLPADNHGYRCRVTAKRTDNGEIAYTDRFFDIYVHNAQSSFTNAPEAKEDLRFNGQWQELVTPGTANGGTVQYLVTTEEIAQSEINNYTFSSSIPKAANIGTYYVWYKIAGDFNHDGTSATDYVTVTIGKAQLQKPAENDTEFVYNGQEQGYFDTASGDSDDEAPNEPIMPEPDQKEPEEPDNDRVLDFTPNPDETKSENGVFGNGDSDDDEGTTPAPGAPTAPVITFDPYAYDITGDTQTDAGTYTVTVTLKDTDHYEWADGTDDELTYDFVISRKPVNIRWGSTEFTYDGTPKLPTATTEDFVEGDAMTLTVTGARTTAGLGYTATAAITGDKADNYKLAGDATTTFSIQKAAQAAPTLGKTDETGEGKADGTITGVDATMEYRVEGEVTYTAITGTKLENLAPGTYYVRVRSGANYDPSPDTVVTIAAAPKKQPAGSDENPKTGDPGTLWLWAALAVLTGGLLATLPRQKKQMR